MNQKLSTFATEDLVHELEDRHATAIIILDRKLDDDRGLVFYSDTGNPFTIMGLLASVMDLAQAKCARCLPGGA